VSSSRRNRAGRLDLASATGDVPDG